MGNIKIIILADSGTKKKEKKSSFKFIDTTNFI